MLKTISGHTSARGIFRYLTKKNRALATDLINIDAPGPEQPGRPLDWARAMDSTRRAFGNDLPWRGKRVRTYKHYVVSPDPRDGISLEALRELAAAWASEHFADHEVAVVYHDDNQNGIPHAHVVVNNTNLETGRRLQDPDPKALAASLQRMAEERGLRALKPPEPEGVAARAERRSPRARPATYRGEYARRAEKEILGRGDYSWTADIRARVRVARAAARSEEEFRGILASLGVTVSDNSPKAPRRDWVYALAEHPTRRVSGERLGLSYGRERLEPMLRAGGMGGLSGEGGRKAADIARRAVEVGNLEELGLLSDTVALIEASRATSLADLDAFAARNPSAGLRDAAAIAGYARAAGILPERRPEARPRKPASARGARGGGGSAEAGRGSRSDLPQASRQRQGRTEEKGR
ncbi:relaxase/mobilization nuclease domain-containing protein [Eggerthella timonensis]|uniref:relaxase/mobilization nuclease domain-containing protein n=1 Tax=Eggerthella timonensis TaxID=1871008 RepID=UPI000C755D35|nr:relaxase/mobilization nuclease domain-containing protein [Eggerthella timonensis]